MNISEINVQDLAQILAENHSELQLIDVREPHEVAIASLPNFKVLPLSQFAQWSDKINTELNPETETIVMCHHGVRSAQMCQWLMNNGFTNVKNLTGGIDAYSLRIDDNIPRY